MAEESILIFKRRGRKEEVKITKMMRGKYSPPDSCVRIVNFKDFKNLALFLHDLEDLWGAPVEKAVKQYLADKRDNWPF